jgi:hypothetical protein
MFRKLTDQELYDLSPSLGKERLEEIFEVWGPPGREWVFYRKSRLQTFTTLTICEVTVDGITTKWVQYDNS